MPVIKFKQSDKNTIKSSLLTNEDLKFNRPQGFDLLQRVAKVFNTSDLVPEQYQGPEKLSNCTLALNLALKLRIDPFIVFRNLYIIGGKPSWSSNFLITLFNMCGRFTNLKYEFVGEPKTDAFGCRAYCTEILTQKSIEGPFVTKRIIKEKGLYNKKNPKWKTTLDLLFKHKAAVLLILETVPELTFGFPIKEVEDFNEYNS